MHLFALIPGQGASQLLRQLADVLGKRSNNSPRVLAGDLDEHREAGIAFDEGGDVRVVRSGKKVSFPMPRHSAILNLGGPLADGDHIEDMPLSTRRVVALGLITRRGPRVLMSYPHAGSMSDDDTLAVIAYIRSVPAAGERTPDPPDQLNLLGLAMLGAGALPSGKPIITTSVTAPPKSPTRQFGEYILSYQDCRECHGARLTGGMPGQMGPLGPDLNVVRDWTLGQFIATMRTGIDPNGVELSNQMPWRPIGRMDNEELAAVYEYLTHLPGSQ